MFGAMVEHLMKEVSAHTYDSRRALRFFRSCEIESDRATPVLIFSFIEHALRELFSAHLNPDIEGGVKGLFDATGPLATASSRIKMLAAIGWISLKTARDLDIVRKIRNEFAHNPPDDGFSNSKIRLLVEKLSPYEAPLITPEAIKNIQLPPLPETIPIRSLFIARTGAAFGMLIEEMLTRPRALSMGLPPDAVHTYDREKMPENITGTVDFAVRIIIESIFGEECK